MSREKITKQSDRSRQSVRDKIFYVAIDISADDKTKADYMSRQKKTMLRHNIQSQQ